MKPTIALAIPHAYWKPERVASLERLLERLGFMSPPTDEGAFITEIFTERCHYTKWATDMWRFLEDSGADWGLQIQDDTIVAPNFWRAFRAMLDAGVIGERDVICLEAAHPAAPFVHICDDPWYTTSDMLIGNSYAARHATFCDFRDFRDFRLKHGAFHGEGAAAITEDTLFGIFCLVTNRRIWCPTRTIIDHDLAIPSTCGNDNHPNRRPLVRWDTVDPKRFPLERFEDPDYWRPKKRVPHVGRGYGLTPAVAKDWVKDLSDEDFARMVADDGVREVIRLKIETRILLPHEDVPSVVLATVTRGAPAIEYMQTVFALQATHAPIEVRQPFEAEKWWAWREDIVRVRSRMLEQFRRRYRDSHLLLVDDDVSFPPVVLQGMIASGYDFVVCPYPSKKYDWGAADDGRSLEARVTKYDNVQPLDGDDPPGDGANCVEIAAAGLGCALLSRRGIDRFNAYLRANREREVMDIFFDDPIAGDEVAFPFAMRPDLVLGRDGKMHRALLSEDLSFCRRWRESGQKIWMYLGPGAPATHHGTHAFRGLIESFEAPSNEVAEPNTEASAA